MCKFSEFFKTVAYMFAVSLHVCPGRYASVGVRLAVPYPCSTVNLYLGVTEDVGVSSLVVVVFLSEHLFVGSILVGNLHITISSAEDVVSEHTAFDMDESVAVYGAVCTSAVDVVPYIRHDVVFAVLRSRYAVYNMY